MVADTLSPVSQSALRNQRFIESRTARLKSNLVSLFALLLFTCFEIFSLKGAVGSTLFGLVGIPDYAVIYAEYALLAYIVAMVTWSGTKMMHSFSKSNFRQTDVASPPAFNERSFCMQSTPITSSRYSGRSDNSWVEDINFGSPNTSHTQGQSSISGKSSRGGSPGGEILSSVMPTNRSKSSPYSKPVDSIHTREQLERLLRKDAENSILDVSSAAKNSSFSYFNLLDMSSTGERKGYKLSEKSQQENKENNTSVVHFDADGRVHLSPAGANESDVDEMSKLRSALQTAKQNPRKVSGSPMLRRTDSALERRRRSHSSPDRQLSSSLLSATECESSVDLDDVALARGEYKLRAWIVNTVLKPLKEQIVKINVKLEKEHANPPLRIGVSSVEALKTALSTRDSLRSTLLPYVLRYLSAHTNQAYLVSRISELSSDTFMTAYNWNTGGAEPADDRNTMSGRISRVTRNTWHEGLPTDAELVFYLFCSYMDSVITSNPLVGSIALDQPFTAVYTLKAPNKPSAALCAPGSAYIHMSSVSPPHLELVSVAEGTRVAMKTPVTKGASNLFYAILQFVHWAKTSNGGKIDMLSIGSTGLGIDVVLP